MTSDRNKMPKNIGNLYLSTVNETTITTIEESGDSLYDGERHNYHLYPKDKKLINEIEKEVKCLKQKIIEELYKIPNCKVIRKREDFNSSKKMDDFLYVYSGGNGSLRVNGKVINYLYQFIPVQKNGLLYELNFMRFFIDRANKVNCILKSIQFDYVCKGEKYVNSKGICYPTSYQNQKKATLDKILSEGKEESFFYNPSVSFDDGYEKITEAFVEFINACDSQNKKVGDKNFIGKLFLEETNRKIGDKNFIGKEVPVYIPCKGKKSFLYDESKGNVHLFPENVELAKSCSNEIAEKRKEIYEALLNECDRGSIRIDGENKKGQGKGSKGAFICKGTKYEEANKLFQFIRLECNGRFFDLIFIRFFKTEENINCILKCFQIKIFKGKEPKALEYYPESGDDGYKNEVYCNFPVRFEESPKNIAKELIEFIKEYEKKYKDEI